MLKLRPEQPFSRARLLRFSGAGLLATGTHLAMLLILGLTAFPLAFANAAAFCTAFIVSMTLQQAVTFADRLQGRRLNAFGLTCMLIANLVVGTLAAHLTGKTWAALALPLLPASINYLLLVLFSSTAWLPKVTSVPNQQ